ncbi:MAG: DUF6326 family protein [Pyrinomonadaceae bacterium]
MKTNELLDSKVNVKIKLATLWAAVTFLYLYGDYFELYVPKKVDGLLNGTSMLDSPSKLFVAAFLLLIPAVMVSLSVFLTPRLNQSLHILAGIFYTIFVSMVGLSSLSTWRAFYVFYAAIEVCLTVTIVVTAWRWERVEVEKK